MKAAIQYILGGFILAGMSGSVWGAAIMKWNENTEKTPVPAAFLRPASLGEEQEMGKAWETSPSDKLLKQRLGPTFKLFLIPRAWGFLTCLSRERLEGPFVCHFQTPEIQ